jgi:glycosyltransferase involved in cell wall biosynthesis
MRLLHFHDRYQTHNPSGETARVLQEARLLQEAGHAIKLLVIDNDQIPRWPAAKRATLPMRTSWSASSYRFVTRAIRSFEPDTVHIHNTFPLASPSVFWAANRTGVPVLHTLANYRLMCPVATFTRDGHTCEDCLGRDFPWPGIIHRCYRGSAAATASVASMIAIHRAAGTWNRAVDVFLVGSDFARRKHIQGGIPEAKIFTKPNTAPDPGRTRRGPGDHYLFVGRLGPEKNVDLLIRGWALANLRPDRHLLVLGDGPDRGRLEALAAELAAPVRFLGSVSRQEVSNHMRRARALVSPSVAYEVSPISVIEAFAARIPCVVPAGGAQAEIVGDGESGLHFRSGDAAALAACLERLEVDADAVRLGKAARRIYELRHSAEAVVSRLEWAYSLARSRKSGARLSRRPATLPSEAPQSTASGLITKM